MPRYTIFAIAACLALGAWAACAWLAGLHGAREPLRARTSAEDPSALERAPEEPRRASSSVYRSDGLEPQDSGAAPDAAPQLEARDLALAEVEVHAWLDHLRRLDELRDVRGIERAIEEFLARWGAVPGFGDALHAWLWREDPPWRPEERRALALIARCWLASAFAAGRYPPADAQRFALELVQRAAGCGTPEALELLRAVLAQDGEDEAPQLFGLPQLGAFLLGHLDASPGARQALLELLEDWGAREPRAESLLRALLGDPRADLRASAYRALLRGDATRFLPLLASLRTEEPELLRSVASWWIQREGGGGFTALRDLVTGIDGGALEALRVASLARDFALHRAALDPAGFDAAWRSLEGDASRAGSSLREGLLQGLGLVKPTREQVDLLFESSFDPLLRTTALQALAAAAPREAAMRLRELALAPSAEDRSEAIFACGNALARAAPPAELIEALSALLDDPRIDRAEREHLATRLAEHIPERIAAWRRAMAR